MYMMTNEKLVGATNTSYLQPKDVGSFLLQVFVDVYLHGTTDKLDTLLEKLNMIQWNSLTWIEYLPNPPEIFKDVCIFIKDLKLSE